MTVSQVELTSFQIPTAMSDTLSLNILLLEVMISSKIEHVVILNLCDLNLKIIFDAWWASMNVGLKNPFAWNIYRQAHCGNSICTVEWRSQEVLAAYASFVIKFFTIHQNMGLAEWGNTSWQKPILLS